MTNSRSSGSICSSIPSAGALTLLSRLLFCWSDAAWHTLQEQWNTGFNNVSMCLTQRFLRLLESVMLGLSDTQRADRSPAGSRKIYRCGPRAKWAQATGTNGSWGEQVIFGGHRETSRLAEPPLIPQQLCEIPHLCKCRLCGIQFRMYTNTKHLITYSTHGLTD